MIKRSYTVEWLRPADATAMAAVEAKVHVPEHRAGQELIWAQLQETELDGRNLSLGLYFGTRLVGFGLGFIMRDRLEMAEFFEAPLPPELNPKQRTIYVADYVVLPEHRQASRLISAKFAIFARMRNDLKNLPMDGFSTAEYADKWRERSRFIAKLGWRAAGCYPFRDPKLGTTLNWLHFERIPEMPRSGTPGKLILQSARDIHTGQGSLTVGLLPSLEAWDQLRPHWDQLLRESGEHSPLQSWEYLRTWHAYFAAISAPLVIVALRDQRPVAIAPLQIRLKPLLGRFLRRATYPTETNQLRPYQVLGADRIATNAIYEFLAANDHWDSLAICATEPVADLHSALRRNRQFVFVHPGPISHRVDIGPESWERFLQNRPGTLQAAFASGISELDRLGPVEFALTNVEGHSQALEEYLSLEQSAPHDELWLGAGVTARQIAFHRELASRYAAELGLFTATLSAANRPIAALYAFLWRRQMHAIHITRTADMAPAAAGIVALGHLIKHCFATRCCATISLPDLPYAATSHWATHRCESSLLQAERTGVEGVIRHVLSRLQSLRTQTSSTRRTANRKVSASATAMSRGSKL